MKTFITYDVVEVDKLSPLNNRWESFIRYFDADLEAIVENNSEAFDSTNKAWEWIANKLKEF